MVKQKTNRGEFSKDVKRVLAFRVGTRCSKPDCRKPTTGEHSDPQKFLNLGQAAHITAASKNGPRYDASLSTKERKSARARQEDLRREGLVLDEIGLDQYRRRGS